MPLNISLPNCTFLLSGGLGLIGHMSFMVVGLYKEIILVCNKSISATLNISRKEMV